jgi:hypothetical protein
LVSEFFKALFFAALLVEIATTNQQPKPDAENKTAVSAKCGW